MVKVINWNAVKYKILEILLALILSLIPAGGIAFILCLAFPFKYVLPVFLIIWAVIYYWVFKIGEQK